MNLIHDLMKCIIIVKDFIIINNKKYYQNFKNYYLKRKEPSFDKILLILLDCSIS